MAAEKVVEATSGVDAEVASGSASSAGPTRVDSGMVASVGIDESSAASPETVPPAC